MQDPLMQLLANDDPVAAGRPWSDLTRMRAERDGPYADFTAWESWFTAACDDTLPDYEPSILDTLDGCQRAYLYNLMARLADGDAPPWVGPDPVMPVEPTP